MAKSSVLQGAVPNEVLRTILREATQRFNHELMDDEERQLLLDRIKSLRRLYRRAIHRAEGKRYSWKVSFRYLPFSETQWV